VTASPSPERPPVSVAYLYLAYFSLVKHPTHNCYSPGIALAVKKHTNEITREKRRKTRTK